MMDKHFCRALFLLIFLAITPACQPWWFTPSSGSPLPNPSRQHKGMRHSAVTKFEINGQDNTKALELIKEAEAKIERQNPCWTRAYRELFSSCSQIMAAEDKKQRLAWSLSNCFQEDTGRNRFPTCSEKSSMSNCLGKLNDNDRNTYLEFFLQINTICHQLQSCLFKSELERLVNDLKDAAENAEDKLETIEQKSDQLLQSSSQIQTSITSIDAQTQHIGHAMKDMLGNFNTVINHSKELKEQVMEIVDAQVELLSGQGRLSEKIDENMAKVAESYENLDTEITSLQDKALDVKEEMNKVGEVMTSQMHNLQGKADNIAAMAGTSIDKQQELLQKQSMALDGLQSLTTFLSDALQESRGSLQQLVDFAHGQHQKLIQQQEQLKQAHEHLADKSRSILANQEALESKQASMFAALDKIFEIHNTMLQESRMIKAFFFYSALGLVIYMITSTKQTYDARWKLYLGLCVAFALEWEILRFTYMEMDRQTQLRTAVKVVFGAYAIGQIIYTILTYRDYDAINHTILVGLMEKLNWIHKQESFREDDDDDVDSEVDWLSWMVDELPEETDINEDPDYSQPATPEHLERHYNLRHR